MPAGHRGQEIGMDAFDRAGERQGVSFVTITRHRGSEAQRWTHPLATGKRE